MDLPFHPNSASKFPRGIHENADDDDDNDDDDDDDDFCHHKYQYYNRYDSADDHSEHYILP